MRRNSALHALAFFAAAILAMQAGVVNASEQEVVVSLFKAHGPCHEIFLQGPFRAASSSNRNSGSNIFVGAGTYTLSYDNNSFSMRSKTNAAAPATKIKSDHIELFPVTGRIAIGPELKKLRQYRGSIEVLVCRRDLVCTNKVNLKDYVNSVVGSESRIEFPKEALKAQSVLVQTAMLRYRKGDELNDSTEKQAYLGTEYERAAVKQAVEETWGQSLYCNSRPVPIFFHSCCAGKTSASDLFTGKASGLPCDKAVDCSFCKDSPFWKTTKTQIRKASYQAKFPEGLPEICSKDSAGRPASVKYSSKRTLNESGYQYWLKIGQRFGWGLMPGTRFEVTDLKNGKIEFSSSGAGHGVGLCQWGAAGMARSGVDYKKILEHYFPGSSLKLPGKKH
jgi:stage II sporulation protein D